jgi:hypothetical protein
MDSRAAVPRMLDDFQSEPRVQLGEGAGAEMAPFAMAARVPSVGRASPLSNTGGQAKTKCGMRQRR